MFAQKTALGLCKRTTTPKPTLDFNNVFEGAKGLVRYRQILQNYGDIEAIFDNEIADWSFTNADGTPYDPLATSMLELFSNR